MNRDVPSEVHTLFKVWLDRTVELHLEAIGKLDVGVSQDLRNSFRNELKRMGEGYLQGDLHFLPHGRFVDMGSGRGYSMGRQISSMERPARGIGRKIKPIYSKIFYARLNDLQGALGFKIMEHAMIQARAGLAA